VEFVSTIIVVAAVAFYLSRSKRFISLMESVTFSTEAKIYWATLQILASYAALMGSVLFEPLKGFLPSLTLIVGVADLMTGIGFSCSSYEFRTFKPRLLLSTWTPIVLGIVIAIVFVFRVLVLKHDRARTTRTHCATGLLLLYIILPSTSVTIFKAFTRDNRLLGADDEQYLLADYAVSIESAEYTGFIMPYAVMCLVVFPIGVNCLYSVLLYKFRHNIVAEKNGETVGRSPISFLHHPFSPECFWWEYVGSSRRVLSVGLPVAFQSPGTRAAVAAIVSVIFLTLKIDNKPYMRKEHNMLANVACSQITGTLLLVLVQASGLTVPPVVGFFLHSAQCRVCAAFRRFQCTSPEAPCNDLGGTQRA
jgi:hypothetical protein